VSEPDAEHVFRLSQAEREVRSVLEWQPLPIAERERLLADFEAVFRRAREALRERRRLRLERAEDIARLAKKITDAGGPEAAKQLRAQDALDEASRRLVDVERFAAFEGSADITGAIRAAVARANDWRARGGLAPIPLAEVESYPGQLTEDA
jgi:hypothetical protein